MLVPDPVIEWAICNSRMDPAGYHYVTHWVRVAQFGLLVAEPEADLEVICHFAMLHDVARINEHHDPYHGPRGADMVFEACITSLSAEQERLLLYAIRFHSDGETSTEPTVAACWDGDRLDLTRLGIDPLPDLMSTDRGRELAERFHVERVEVSDGQV